MLKHQGASRTAGTHMAGDGYVASKAKWIGPQNNPMIRLGLDPKTPNDIGENVAFGNHFGKMLMMFVVENVFLGAKIDIFTP